MANCSASNSNPAGSTSANNPRSNPVHGYQSLIKDQPAIRSAEMTKYLKQNFMAPKGDGKYKPEHIVHKTSTIRVPSSDHNTWKNHFLRRKSHLEKGFFTPSYKSYSSVGSVELNPQQLVLDVFQECLSKKRAPLPSILTGRLPVRSSPCQDTQHSQIKSPSNVHHSSTGGLDFSDEDIQSAGFSFIKHNLKDSEKMLIANKGGLPFDQCLRDIERSKEMSQDDDSQSAVTFLPPVQGDNNIPMVPTMEIYAMPISSAPDPTRPCSKTRAAEKDREMEQERMFFNRSRRLMVEKLRTIQMVLNALHNIKSRDLRSRVPLSLETVKVLFKDIADKPFQSRPVKDVHHSSNDTVNSPDKLPISGLTSKTAIPTRKVSTMGRTEGLVSTTPTFQWRKHRQNIMHPKKEPRVETWEDLVTMPSPSHGHRHSVLPSMVPNPVGRWVGQHRHGDSQKLPLWQTVGVANEDKVTRPAPSTKSKNGTSREHPDPEATLKSLIQNFTRVKKKLAREVHSDLERLLRDRNRTFRQKFHCLTKSPLFERTMQHLKEVSASQPVPVITEDTTTEIKSSKWYTDLKSGAENVVGKGDKEVNLLLQQLARFSLEDAKSIPNAKEKLCLLVMSMPASQLLTIPAQQALKYVLEEILWASSECLSQWLNHRKIPMILQETSV